MPLWGQLGEVPKAEGDEDAVLGSFMSREIFPDRVFVS